MCLLAGKGEFELAFERDGHLYKVTLDQHGDFVIWGPGCEHYWRPLKRSTIVTIRWRPADVPS